MSDGNPGREIAAILFRYSTAMDRREWHLMEDVFTPDVVTDIGGLVCHGRAETVKFIRAAIECCERTHHMNSNVEIEAHGEMAHVTSKFAAWHTGRCATRDQIFLALGSYSDEFVRTPAGWRIRRRAESTHIEVWQDASRPGNLAEFFAAAFALTRSPESG